MNIITFIITELFYILLIAGIIAGGTYYLINSFWPMFFIMIAFQFIVGAFVNKYIQSKNLVKMREIISRNKLAESYQTITLNCAYCSVHNNVRYVFNSEGIFECVQCKNKNKIILNVMTARVTEPLPSDVVVSNIFKELEKIEKNDK